MVKKTIALHASHRTKNKKTNYSIQSYYYVFCIASLASIHGIAWSLESGPETCSADDHILFSGQRLEGMTCPNYCEPGDSTVALNKEDIGGLHFVDT